GPRSTWKVNTKTSQPNCPQSSEKSYATAIPKIKKPLTPKNLSVELANVSGRLQIIPKPGLVPHSLPSLKASQMASNWTYSTPCPTISPPMRSGRYKSRIEKGVNTYAIRRDHKNSY